MSVEEEKEQKSKLASGNPWIQLVSLSGGVRIWGMLKGKGWSTLETLSLGHRCSLSLLFLVFNNAMKRGASTEVWALQVTFSLGRWKVLRCLEQGSAFCHLATWAGYWSTQTNKILQKYWREESMKTLGIYLQKRTEDFPNFFANFPESSGSWRSALRGAQFKTHPTRNVFFSLLCKLPCWHADFSNTCQLQRESCSDPGHCPAMGLGLRKYEWAQRPATEDPKMERHSWPDSCTWNKTPRRPMLVIWSAFCPWK